MTTLETLLVAIRDGTAPEGAVERARALAAEDERIPPELRELVLLDPAEAPSDAAGLLAVLGADNLGELLAEAVMDEIGTLDLGFDLNARAPAPRAEDQVARNGRTPDPPDTPPPPEAALELDLDDTWAPIGASLREGLLEEAGHIEIAEAVMRRIPLADFPWGPVVASAVVSEAGSADVAQGVLSAIGGRLVEQPPVAAAIRAEAGSVEVADAVMRSLGIELLPVAEAVRAHAGSVDVADRVMALVAPQEQLVPANNRWVLVSLLMAALALLVVVVGRLATPIGGTGPEPLRFAHASEVIIEDLNYASDVQVMVLEGDDGAVILWFDEEA